MIRILASGDYRRDYQIDLVLNRHPSLSEPKTFLFCFFTSHLLGEENAFLGGNRKKARNPISGTRYFRWIVSGTSGQEARWQINNMDCSPSRFRPPRFQSAGLNVYLDDIPVGPEIDQFHQRSRACAQFIRNSDLWYHNVHPACVADESYRRRHLLFWRRLNLTEGFRQPWVTCCVTFLCVCKCVIL